MPRNGTSLQARRPFPAVLDVGLAVVIAIVSVRTLVPRRALLGLWPATELATLVVIALALLAVRIAIASRSDERAGVAPGSWFGGLRPPAFVLAAAFALVVASRPPTASPMGADEGPHLRQLAGLYLEGRLTEAGLEPGPTLVWGPFYLLAHAVTLVLHAAGFNIPADGWSEPYRNAVRLGSAVCALVAASLTWDTCRRFFPPVLAVVCVVGLWLGSTLFYYSWAEPAMCHAPAAALTSLLVWLWLRLRDGGAGAPTWVAAGIVAGLLVSTQRYDVYFLLLPFSVVAGALVTRTGSPLSLSRHRLMGAAAIVALLAVVPLFLVGLRSRDAFLVHPAAIARVFLSEWRRPHVAEVLFSSNGGLFAWTPLALVGVVGLLGFARRHPRTALPLLGALGLGILLLSSNSVWWAGWSFGARRLTEAFPVFAIGLCAAAEWLLRRPALLASAALAGLVGLNLSWSHQTWIGRIPRGDAVSFAEAGSGALESVHGVLGHPFSWPMPWLFAWRYGVAPGQADTLFGRVPRDRWDLRIGSAEDAAILGRGWSRPAEDDTGAPFRWSLGPVSTILVTLTAPEARVLAFSATGVRSPTDFPQALDLYVNRRLLRRLELSPRLTEHMLIVPREFWVGGLNEIALRSAWQLGSSDARALGEAPDSGLRVGAFSLRPLRPTPG
jgi:hypothetical protein